MASILKRNLAADYAWLLAQKFNVVDMLGLPSYKDTRSLSLEEIYVPLRFQWKLNFNEKEKPFWLPKLMSEAKHLVVLGDPGSGKSTLIKFLIYSFGRQGQTTLVPRFGKLLPIPIVLREFKVATWQNLEDMLRDFIATLSNEVRDHVSVEWFLDYLRKGEAILMLDGLDEIGSVELRRNFRDKVVRPLVENFPDSYLILTSRIIGYEEVPFDKSTLEFDSSKMTPQRHLAERQLLPGLNLRRAYVAPFTDEDISQFIKRWYTAREPDKELRQEGIEALNRALQVNDRVRRLAQNPSLLTLIALVFRVLRHLPSGRVQLYHKIVEAYLETIQTYRQLSQYPATLDQMKRWLARVGWEMQSLRTDEKQGDLLAPTERVLGWLAEAIKQDLSNDKTAVRHEAEQFLDYVARRSGLLIPRGTDNQGELFAFVHLTFQEYFAAWELRGRMRRFDQLAELCAERVKHTYWHETLLLLFEVLAEFQGFGDDLVEEICRKVEADPASGEPTAQLLSALLLDTQNGLSEAGQRRATEFTREQLCREFDYSVIERLKQLSAEHRSRWIEKPLIEQLKSAKPETLAPNFFLISDEFVTNWPRLIEEELVGKRSSENWSPNQLVLITLIGTGRSKVIEWGIKKLPIQDWLAKLDRDQSFGALVTVEDREFHITSAVSIAELNATLILKSEQISPSHYLLAQSVMVLVSRNGQILRTIIAAQFLRKPLMQLPPQSLEHSHLPLAFCFFRIPDRYSDKYLLRFVDLDFQPSWCKYLDASVLSSYLEIKTPVKPKTVSTSLSIEIPASEIAEAEWLAFQPDREEDRLVVIERNHRYLKAEDDWTRLLAINNLLTLSEGTPELVAERNRLCDRAMQQPDQFTFPAELREATQNKEWFNLPEIIAIIFLHKPGDPFLKPEWFDPKREESKFFLTPPREFFALAAEVLDPKGETELAKWRK